MLGRAERVLGLASVLSFAALVFSACANLEASFQVISFQEQEHTGIARGQELSLHVVTRAQSNAKLVASLPPLVRDRYTYGKDRFHDVIDACSLLPPTAKPEAFVFSPLAGALIGKAAQILYDSVFSEIESRRDKLQARSQYKSAPLRSTWSTAGSLTWQKVTCVVLARVTDLGRPTGGGGFDGKLDGVADEIGLLVVLARVDRGGTASIFRPVFVEMNNAVALTGASQNPSIQVDLGVSVRPAVATGVKDPIATVIPPITARLRAETPVCKEPSYLGDIDSCPMSSEMFSNPPADATALQLSVIVSETGSGVPTKEAVQAGDKILKDLSKPVFDEFLKALADASKAPAKGKK